MDEMMGGKEELVVLGIDAEYVLPDGFSDTCACCCCWCCCCWYAACCWACCC